MKYMLLPMLIFASYLNLYAQPAGSLDPSFGNGGKVVTSLNSGAEVAQGVALQADQKIVVAGYASSTVTGKDFFCARYKTNGSLDSTFGTNGIVTVDIQLGSDDIAYDLAIQLDGKIVLGGSSDNGTKKDAALLRLNTDGSIDATFGTGGKVTTVFESNQTDEIRVVKVHHLTGNIVVGGSSLVSTNISKPVVARYLSNGTLDVSFNATGIKLLWVTNLDYQYLFSVEDLVVQSNGKISAVGWRDFPTFSSDDDFWACRINTDGTMDNTFSTDGVALYNGSFNGADNAYSMLLKSNGNILIAGKSEVNNVVDDFILFEVDASGTVGSWSATVNFGNLYDDAAYGLAEDQDGKFVLAGSSSNGFGSDKSFAIARINSNASIDNSFGTNGQVTTSFGSNTVSESFDMLVQADNKIVAVGYTGNDIALARYLGNGVPQLDSFNLVSPADLAIEQRSDTLNFDWTDAFGATSYTMEMDTLNTFATAQTYNSISSLSSLEVTNLQPVMTYYWRVKSSDGSTTSQWSDVWEFTTKDEFDSVVKLFEVAFDIYPNPTSDVLNIEIPKSLEGKSYLIVDDLGKVIQEGLFKNSSEQVSLKGFPSGMYHLYINGVLGRSFVKK